MVKWIQQKDGTFKAATDNTTKRWKKKKDGTFEEDIAPVKETTKKQSVSSLRDGAGTVNEDGYTYTGKNYGDYWYQNYATDKDNKIYSKDGNYFVYDGKNYRNVDQISFMTTKELSEKEYNEAKKLGFTGSKSTLSHVSEKLKLDTADLTSQEYTEYEKDLLRQQDARNKEAAQNRQINYGGAGLKGAVGEIKTAFSNVANKVDKEIIAPVKNFSDNYETGKLNNQLALEYYKKMQGEENNADELAKKVEVYNSFNQDLLNNPGATGTAIQQLNTQVESIKNQGIAATILSGVGAGIGAIATRSSQGAIAGAKVGAGIGYALGSTPYMYKLEAGNQYKALTDMGVPDDIAKKYSKITGGVNAAIESGENVVDIFTFGAAGKTASISKEAVSDMIDEYGESQVKKWLKNKVGEETAETIVKGVKVAGVSYLQNIGSEALEESLQETTSITTERLATNEAGIEREATLKDDLGRILESGVSAAISTAFTSPLTSLGGSIVTNTVNSVETKIASKKGKKITSSEINEVIRQNIEKENPNLTTQEVQQIQSEIFKELQNDGVEITDIQQSVENIDNQIIELEKQLAKTENDAEYERISNQIRALEEKANQIEQQEIAPVQKNAQKTENIVQNTQETTDIVPVKSSLTQNKMKNIEGTKLTNKDGYEYTIPKSLFQGKRTDATEKKTPSMAKFGDGEYYTPRLKRAEGYGKVTEYNDINDKFQNPYIQGTPYNSKMIELLNEYKANNPDKAIHIDRVLNNGMMLTQEFMSPQEITDMYVKAGYDSFIGGTDAMPEYLSFSKPLTENNQDIAPVKQNTEEHFSYKEYGEVSKELDNIEREIKSELDKEYDNEYAKLKEEFNNLLSAPDSENKGNRLRKIQSLLNGGLRNQYESRLEEQLNIKAKDLLNRKDELQTLFDKDWKERFKQEDDIAPIKQELSDLTSEIKSMMKDTKKEIKSLKKEINEVVEDYKALTEAEANERDAEQNNIQSFTDEDIAPIKEDTTPEFEEEITSTKSLEDIRDFDAVGSRKVKAYQYENPEVRPYFQEMATYMLGDLENSVKGERNFNDQLYYDTAGEQGFYGTTRQTTDDIAALLDSKYNYTYKDIRKGLEAIIKDHGAENIAVAKRIELALDKRLREGYTDVSGYEIPANEDYLKLMEEKEIENYYDSLPIDESMIPPEEDIAPVVIVSNKQVNNKNVPIREQLKENSVVEEKPTKVEQETAQILDERPTPKNKDRKLKAIATVNLVDKGYYISKLARQTDNRQLDALWDNTLLSNAQAQEVIGEGRFKFNEDTKTYDKVGNSVYEIFEGLETTNKVKDFNEYMYHKLNIERMSLEDKAQLRMKELKETTLKEYTNEDINAMAKTKLREDAKEELVNLVEAAKEYKSLSKVKNKPVFGYRTDANKSIEIVTKLEQNNPEFSDYAKKVYDYESGTYSDLSLLVESGILSQEDANYYRNKYESYVPIIRDIEADTMEKQMFGKRASVGNAVKGATGGSQNIIPLKDAMAIKTMLVQRSANMNKLGLELMEALNPVVESETVSAENIIEDISGNKDLIQAGTNGKAPTMTVYEHGVKKTFEIPVEIYETLKTNYDSFSKVTIKPLNAFSSFKRNVLTQYNPFFMVTNMIKDAQDVLINSQHPATTYKAIPEAIAQLKNKGYWYKEMQAQGLFQDTYYDNQGGFDTTKKGIDKISEFYPLKKIAEVNDFIERVPRMAEYIASRKAGRSVEVASLDASRVTTNFKAGGDWTKFFNRNGATFLNASVQGALQQVRNVQEAHQKGLKGYMALATKFTIAALPAVLLNNLIWDDDDEYEELSDYIKDNYYIIGKYGDGQFIRIPKGRMTAVIQKTIEEMQNLVTGNDEADLGSYLELVVNNLAPSNPIENNIFSPFLNTKLFNKDDAGKTWYGGDLVPTRLQDKPAAEQYDETTDEFSKWLGEKLNLSPIKINNLIDQNTGVIGDLLLPMMTAEAKTKNDNPIMAGIEDKFTADVVFDNKYSTDFYSVKEDLAKKSNSYEATDEDVLKTKYMNSKQAQMNDIYAEIREVQNSDLDKKTKYAQVRDLREQLNDIAETSLNDYKKVNIESSYAKVGDIEFRKNDSGEWQKITSKQLEKQNEVINTLGASANNYWENKEEYDYAIENPTKYNAISQIDTYDNYIKYKDDIADIKEQLEGYSTAQRKAAVQEYIESLSLSVPKKIMLEKLAGGYSIKDYEGYMFEYIESLPMSAKEKQELHKQLFD